MLAGHFKTTTQDHKPFFLQDVQAVLSGLIASCGGSMISSSIDNCPSCPLAVTHSWYTLEIKVIFGVKRGLGREAMNRAG
jgi:hypothetical protein